jgi:hypothetical protein
MSIQYRGFLRQIEGDQSSNGSFEIFAESDDEAIQIMKQKLEGQEVLYINGQPHAHGWYVSTLVNMDTGENVWKEAKPKTTNSQSGGGSHKRLTKEKVVIGKKTKCVYVGPKGGRYVKGSNGKFVSI